MYRKLINTLAQQRNTTPFRVMGITVFHFVAFDPAVVYNETFEVHGAYVDVSGKRDVIRILDCYGAWHPLEPNRADDQEIVMQLLNVLNYARLNTAVVSASEFPNILIAQPA